MKKFGLVLQQTKDQYHILDFLTSIEKNVFKTAFELDQKWIVELGADQHALHVSQAQSINIVFTS